jgi:thiosulfate reductase cytochrome b subunit
MRHPAFVRVTHWMHACAFFALLVSGMAILLAHPRLYWGETGALGGASLLDLPLPMILTGQSGWGRSLHFLAAWICVVNGAAYVAIGIVTRHFSPGPSTKTGHGVPRYSALQHGTYLVVVFALLPLMVWTGLAMSPAVTSVMPSLVTVLGGQQSARTIHFFIAAVLAAFVAGHVAMVAASGFTTHIRAMITGREPAVTTESV